MLFWMNKTVLEMQKKVKDAGYPIATMVTYSNMGNYESVDSFLKECMEGKRGSAMIYEIQNDGGLGRMKFIFDGTDMYVVSTRGIWNTDGTLQFSEEIKDSGYYIVYSWGSGNSLLEEMDIRGH